jgi:hypothetical protein
MCSREHKGIKHKDTKITERSLRGLIVSVFNVFVFPSENPPSK